MRRLLTTLLTSLILLTVQAQMMDPVHFTSQLKELKGGEGEIVFSGTIDPGWHVYSTNLGNDGPISATFNPVKMEGVETVGLLQPRGKEIKQFDKVFDMELRYFEKAVTFVQKVRFTKPQYDIDCYLEYGACNDKSCMPPSTCDLKKTGKSPLAADSKEGPDSKDNNYSKEIRSLGDSAQNTETKTPSLCLLPAVLESPSRTRHEPYGCQGASSRAMGRFLCQRAKTL